MCGESSKKYYIIYKITNTINEKYYIGKHKTSDINDGYLGSGVAIRNAVKKYGEEKFRKEILYELSSETEMDDKEAEIVNEEMINDPMCYNMRIGGIGGFSRDEAIRGSKTPKSIANRFDHVRARELGKLGGSRSKGRKLSEEHKEKIRQYRKSQKDNGWKQSPESIAKREQTRKENGINGIVRCPKMLTTILQPDGKIIQTNNLEYYRYQNDLGRVIDSVMARKGHVILQKIKVCDLPNKENLPREPFIITENFWELAA